MAANPELMTNIQEMDLHVNIDYNKGTASINKQVKLLNLPFPFWINESGIVCAVSLKTLKQHYKVTYNNEDGEGGTFFIHTKNRVLKV